jgi:hypothetical protein
MLPLFSDVEEDGAPMRIRVGAHLDVPALLAPAGSANSAKFITTIPASGTRPARGSLSHRA